MEAIASQKNASLQSLVRSFPRTRNSVRLPRGSREGPPKPFVQWVGGKRESIPAYLPLMPQDYSRYYEPFAGGAAMYFHLLPEASILGDINPELIAAYRGVRDYPNEVIKLLKALKARHSRDLYLAIRSIDREYDLLNDLHDAEIAARLIYLNNTGFNGLYRVNRQGQFNVPIGSTLDRLIVDPEELIKSSRALNRAVFRCGDFQEVCEGASRGSFVYMDPPYHPVGKYSDFTRYSKEQFTEQDQVRLRSFVNQLVADGAMVMLSNSDCRFVRDLYADFTITQVFSSRSLSADTKRRGKVPEVIITTYT